jgi:aminoglycoside N3'-acetyltransferase
MKFNSSYFQKKILNSNLLEFDLIYIYSDFRFFFSQNKNQIDFLNDILNIFLKNKKTIIIPAFSYTKTNYHVDKTKSLAGFLSNFLLNNKNSRRSHHPLFSYLATGPKKKIVNNIGKSSFGNNCLHSKLLFNNCAFFHIGRGLEHGNTLVHHVEQNLNADYRFDKIFKSKTYKNNNYIGTNYKAFVRRKIDRSTEFTFKKILENKKLKKLIVNLNKEKDLKSLFYYSFDEFYFLLHELYIKNRNIFIKKKED